MNNCPCCSNQLLRHLRQNEVYWFCRSCRQEMPLLNLSECSLYQKVKVKIGKLPRGLHKQEKVIDILPDRDVGHLPEVALSR
jgi:hypothetical protein